MIKSSYSFPQMGNISWNYYNMDNNKMQLKMFFVTICHLSEKYVLKCSLTFPYKFCIIKMFTLNTLVS